MTLRIAMADSCTRATSLRRGRAGVAEAMPLTDSLDRHDNLTKRMVRLADALRAVSNLAYQAALFARTARVTLTPSRDVAVPGATGS